MGDGLHELVELIILTPHAPWEQHDRPDRRHLLDVLAGSIWLKPGVDEVGCVYTWLTYLMWLFMFHPILKRQMILRFWFVRSLQMLILAPKVVAVEFT